MVTELFAVCVSSRTASLETVTCCCAVPTCSAIFTVADVLARRIILDRRKSLNPVAVAEIWYVPGSKFVKMYSPFEPEVPSRVSLVAKFSKLQLRPCNDGSAGVGHGSGNCRGKGLRHGCAAGQDCQENPEKNSI